MFTAPSTVTNNGDRPTLLDAKQGIALSGSIHARINQRGNLPGRKRSTADNQYYVRFRITLSQMEILRTRVCTLQLDRHILLSEFQDEALTRLPDKFRRLVGRDQVVWFA